MSDEQGTVFVDGLRVTAQHLNHLERSAQQAVGDLRRVLGLAHVGYGLRIEVAEDGQSATLTPGLAFTAGGHRLSLDEGATLTIPDGDGPFAVALAAANHDDPTTRVGDTPTIVFSDTSVTVAADAPAGPTRRCRADGLHRSSRRDGAGRPGRRRRSAGAARAPGGSGRRGSGRRSRPRRAARAAGRARRHR